MVDFYSYQTYFVNRERKEGKENGYEFYDKRQMQIDNRI